MKVLNRFGALLLAALLPIAAFSQTPITITALPAAATLTGTEVMPGDQGSCPTCTVKITPLQLSNYVQANSGFLTRIAGQIYVGASGDTSGVADLANLQAAVASLASSTRLPPLASQFYPTSKILLGPGTFYFTAGKVNLLAASSLKTQGVWIQGSGRGITSFDYNPTVSAPEFINNHALDVKITDITFVGHDPASDFLWSQEQAGLTNVQDYTFVDDEWIGSWNNGFRLTGGNNNSEWKFERDTVGANISSWVYTPPAIATTITSGSSTIAAANTAEQVEVGDTGSLSAAVSPLAANTSYYVVSASLTGFQIATTPGGTPVTFLANSTPTFQTASDQFLNFWFSQIKFDTGSSLGQWLTLNFGGSVKVRDSDVSGHAPPVHACVFNLLGISHSRGVQNFETDGVRIEHSNNNSCTIHSQWSSGSIVFNNLDESSQSGLRAITNQYAIYELVNAPGPLIRYENAQLMGVHSYSNNSSNFQFQNQVVYDTVSLLDNPTAANFIAVTNNGNSGGLPNIHFKNCRNGVSSATVGYHEVCDTDLFWNSRLGGQTDSKVTSCVGTNSDWPFSGGSFELRLPLNAMITRVRYWNPGGSGAGGAYQYTIQTLEATPTILAGGPASPMSGSNASTPLPVTSMYVTTPNFVMTSDAARTIIIQDTLTLGRTGIFTGMYCLIDYIG